MANRKPTLQRSDDRDRRAHRPSERAVGHLEHHSHWRVEISDHDGL